MRLPQFLTLLLLFVVGAAPDHGKPTDSLPQDGPHAKRFYEHHEICLTRRTQHPDLIFLGDSITEGWEWGDAPAIWRKLYEPLHAANFGISSDRTQNVIWRITEGGELEGVRAKVAVVMIGTNNIGHDKTDEIAAGVERIVRIVQEKSPATKVLLLGIFPRTMGGPDAANHVTAVNARLAKLDNGSSIRFLDIGDKFAPDAFTDGLHLSITGYQIWANAMQPLLLAMMKP